MSVAASLDDLAQHPEKLADLTPITARALLVKYAGLHAALLATAFPVEDTGQDRLLTAREASERTGLSEDYFYRNASDLPFTVRPSKGRVRFSEKGLAKYMKMRQGK